MNIAMVVYSHYSRDARVRRYGEALARKGYNIDVICLTEEYQTKEKNINFIKYPLNRYRLGFIWYIFEYLLFFLFCITVLSYKQIIRRYKVIHINNIPDFLIFSALIPKLTGAKIVLDMHDSMPELFETKYKNFFTPAGSKTLEIIEKLSMKFSDHVLTANEFFRDIFIKRGSMQPEKIGVIANYPDERIFSPKLNSVNHDTFNLYYTGTVEKRFGLDIVIEAMPMITKSIPNIKFIIIPKIEKEGHYFEYLVSSIKNQELSKYVEIKKPMPVEKIAQELRKADIGIVLAKDGIFTNSIVPVKLLEFIQMNIPVIATKTKSLSKYFNNNDLIYLNNNTPDEFIKTATRIYKNKKLRQKYAQNAKKYLVKNNWKNEEKKYLYLINNLIKESN